ncbi:MAG: hypothetical protein KA190_16620 [Kofleriaceae bacterium]|nr:hypothetical protein [Kofleriaceae bacterium]
MSREQGPGRQAATSAPLAQATGPEAAPGTARKRAAELKHAAMILRSQASADLEHIRMLRELRTEHSFVGSTIELAGRASELLSGKNLGPLELPSGTDQLHAITSLDLALNLLTAALGADEATANQLTNQAMGSLAAGSRQFEASHQLLSSYTERTDRGGEVAQATIKGALMTIAVASTGAWAAGAFAVSSGGIGALAASSAATATVAGVTAGGFTAIEQLNAGQFDPGAIGQAALAEAARTFVTGLAGGVLERAFSAALSSAVTRVAGQVPAEAARILQGEGASQVIAFLAGTSSGALVSSVETVLRERAAGRPMSTDEFCRLLVTEMIKGGLYQLAVNAVVRRAKRGFVDRRGQTQEETVAAGSAKDKYILQTIEDKKQAYELLLPETRDHNNAIYYNNRPGMPVVPGARGMAMSGDNAYLHESLYVSGHGSPFGVSGGNREVANMAAKAVLQLAKDGHPVARVVLDACSQRDKRFAFFGKSNAQAFEAVLQQELKGLGHQGPAPTVFAHAEAGPIYAQTMADHAPVPASLGGANSPDLAKTAGLTLGGGLGGGVLLGALADLLMNHPDLLGAVMKLFAGGEGAAGADAPGRTSTPEG